jgi:hypothetical protein
MQLVIIGAMLNSALYLFCCWYNAVVFGPPAGRYLAIATFGVTYLSYSLQAWYITQQQTQAVPAWFPRWLPNGLVWLSMITGAAAGLSLFHPSI